MRPAYFQLRSSSFFSNKLSRKTFSLSTFFSFLFSLSCFSNPGDCVGCLVLGGVFIFWFWGNVCVFPPGESRLIKHTRWELQCFIASPCFNLRHHRVVLRFVQWTMLLWFSIFPRYRLSSSVTSRLSGVDPGVMNDTPSTTGSPPFNWIKTGPLGARQAWSPAVLMSKSFQSPCVSRMDLAISSRLKLWLSLENRAVLRGEKKQIASFLAQHLTWFQISPFLLPWKSVAYAR